MTALAIGDTVVAGPISAVIGTDLALRDIRVRGHRALDAVYFAVRDEAWRTIASSIEQFEGVQTQAGFEFTFRLRHLGPSTDVLTNGKVTGCRDSVEVEVVIESRRDQLFNRVGLSVLHPIELRGNAVTVTTDDGQAQVKFPERIAPHQPFQNMRGLTQNIADGVDLEIAFDGGVFETEDHRNWTDAGWKTYSPPLADPAPQQWATAQTARQAITLRPQVSSGVIQVTPQPVTITISDRQTGHIPRIGLSAFAGMALSVEQISLISRIAPHFVQVELVDGSAATQRLQDAVAEARKIGSRLHVLLALRQDRLGFWARELGEASDIIDAVTVVDIDTHVSSARLIEGLREGLRDSLGAPSISVGGGTRGYFAELNRSSESLGAADYLQYSISAEVHHFDDRSVFDTLLAQRDTLDDALRIAEGRPVHVGPITLRERLSLHTGSPEEYAPYSSEFESDPRTGEQFAAAWVVGAVSSLCRADALTFFATSGPGGVIAADRAGLTPAGEILSKIVSHREHALLAVDVSEPRHVSALAFRGQGERVHIIVANHDSPEAAVSVVVAGLDRQLLLPPYGVLIV